MSQSTNLTDAIGLLEQEQIESAVEILQQVLINDPACSEALHLLGQIASQSGNHIGAIACFERAIAIDPDVAEFYFSCGEAYLQSGNQNEAINCFKQVIELNPDHAIAYNRLGVLLHEKGDNCSAKKYFLHAVRVSPSYCEANFNLGQLLYDEGNLDGVAISLVKALRIDPEHIPSLELMAKVAIQQRQFDEAEGILQKIHALDSDDIDTLIFIGNSFNQIGRYDVAVGCLKRAFRFDRHHPEVHHHLGYALFQLDRFDEAVTSYQAALLLAPDNSQVQLEYAELLREMGDVNRSVMLYEQIIQTEKENQVAHNGLGRSLLLQGDYVRGWREYGWREQLAIEEAPLWKGEDLAGKRLLLDVGENAEDAFQFIRFVSALSRQGAEVIVRCAARMKRILQGVDGISSVIEAGEACEGVDYCCSLFDLLSWLEVSPQTISSLSDYPYLVPHEDSKFSTVNSRLFKVGVDWCCKGSRSVACKKSCPLSLFLALSTLPGIQLYSLQLCAEKASQTLMRSLNMVDLTDQVGDYDDQAQLIGRMDLVLTVDGAQAHLAAGMGVPVWLLLPFTPGWRWSQPDNIKYWYPSLRLFRQPSPGDWQGVIEEVRQALEDYYPGKSAAAC